MKQNQNGPKAGQGTRDLPAQIASTISPKQIAAMIERGGPEERRTGVQKLAENVPALRFLATSSRHSDVRSAAIEILTDQDVLAHVVLDGKEGAMLAFEKLTDECALARVVGCCQPYFRPAAVEKLSKMVNELTSQKALTQLAIHGSPEVRLAAFEKLTDQRALTEVVFNSKQFKLAAVEKLSKMVNELTDQNALKQVAIHGGQDAGLAAVEKLSKMVNELTQIALANVAKKAKEQRVQLAALDKLDDNYLFEIVADNPVGLAAVDKLTDQYILMKVAMEADSGAGCLAVEKIAPQDLLRRVATYAKNLNVRFAAIAKLTNKGDLEFLANHSDNPNVRPAAVKRLIELGFDHQTPFEKGLTAILLQTQV
jgi:hypothetical protein